MNFQLLIPLLITSTLTIIGWYILYKLNQQRDRENKKKDQRINFLIDAWKKLEFASNRDISHEEFIENIEKPIAAIQLFGNENQIKIAQKFIDEVSEKGNAELNYLLEELRNDLREELHLEKTASNIKYIRFRKNT